MHAMQVHITYHWIEQLCFPVVLNFPLPLLALGPDSLKTSREKKTTVVPQLVLASIANVPLC